MPVHCGAKSYRHPECRNSNSIGIELCVRNKREPGSRQHRDWYFENATVQAAIEPTRELIEKRKYGIPADRVIRHHAPVTGKISPEPLRVQPHSPHLGGFQGGNRKERAAGGSPEGISSGLYPGRRRHTLVVSV